MIGNLSYGFFACRWHSEVTLQVLPWRDLLIVGTLINFAAGFATLLKLTQDVAPVFALAVHLAPLPYNTFLLLSVWRSKGSTRLASTVAGIWFPLMLIF